MDPVTQGALGGAVAQALVGHRLGRRTWVLGALAGMAPDLDVFIRGDALTGIEFHRHFTHSLAFAPIGAALCVLPVLAFKRWRAWRGRPLDWSPRWIFLCALAGWLTHAPLDGFTSYGTMLYWPFSHARAAWDVMSIVDLLYTVPLIAGLVAARRYGQRAVVGGLVVAHVYMALCGVQRLRADAVQSSLVAERGHQPKRGKALPYVLSNVIWRSIYEFDDRVHVDMIVTPWFGESTVLDGHAIPLVRSADQLPEPWLSHPRRDEAFELMTWFGDGWVGIIESPDGDPLLCDLRLSIHPTETLPVVCLSAEDGELKRAQLGGSSPPGELLEATLETDPGQRRIE